MRSSNGVVSTGAIPEDMKVMMRRCDSLLAEVKKLKHHNSALETEVSACRRKQLLAPFGTPSKSGSNGWRWDFYVVLHSLHLSSDNLSSASEDRMERVVGLAVEGDIGEIDVAESILRERLKARQIK